MAYPDRIDLADIPAGALRYHENEERILDPSLTPDSVNKPGSRFTRWLERVTGLDIVDGWDPSGETAETPNPVVPYRQSPTATSGLQEPRTRYFARGSAALFMADGNNRGRPPSVQPDFTGDGPVGTRPLIGGNEVAYGGQAEIGVAFNQHPNLWGVSLFGGPQYTRGDMNWFRNHVALDGGSVETLGGHVGVEVNTPTFWGLVRGKVAAYGGYSWMTTSGRGQLNGVDYAFDERPVGGAYFGVRAGPEFVISENVSLGLLGFAELHNNRQGSFQTGDGTPFPFGGESPGDPLNHPNDALHVGAMLEATFKL
ncbi:MAG: hypothetical protein AAFV36_02180 [Myxococcota bacterium]